MRLVLVGSITCSSPVPFVPGRSLRCWLATTSMSLLAPPAFSISRLSAERSRAFDPSHSTDIRAVPDVRKLPIVPVALVVLSRTVSPLSVRA